MKEKINQAFYFFEALEKTTSKLDKLTILNAANNNHILYTLLDMCYSPHRVYNIKKLPGIVPLGTLSEEDNYTNFIHLLENLQNRTFTGNEAINKVANVFKCFNNTEYKWYSRVLQKDLNVGIQEKTINLARPNFIQTFNVMLATPFKDFPEEFIMQPKFDGMRIIADTTTGDLFSRNGKKIEGFVGIEEEIRILPSGYFIDGELISTRNKLIICMEDLINSSFQSTMRDAFAKAESKIGIIFAFDILDKENFLNKKISKETFPTRASKLNEMLLDKKNDFIRQVRTSQVFNRRHKNIWSLVEQQYINYLNLGYEGAIIKDVNGVYNFKRSNLWQKIKPSKTFDLKVIDIEEGTSKYENMLGKLVCDFDGIYVRVGTGISDELRKEWWENPNSIVGKIVEVEAQDITKNLNNTNSLRFPRFKTIREDK